MERPIIKRDAAKTGEIIPPALSTRKILFYSDQYSAREMVEILIRGIRISYDPNQNGLPVTLEYPLVGEIISDSVSDESD